jgi:hypothetical protein
MALLLFRVSVPPSRRSLSLPEEHTMRVNVDPIIDFLFEEE